MHGDHAHGFMVAGLTRMTMLDEVRQAMMAAIQNGESYDKFRARFDKTLGKAWSTLRGGETEAGRAWRTRLIYQTNLRTSYMAGRWETLQKYPYLKYQHNTVDNPRESHQALDGKIIPTRDPWWDTHYPPNGWMCRCTVTGVSEARLRAMRGADAQPDEPPPTDPKDPPPEWAYHVGKASRSMAAAERFGQKVMQLPPAWRKAVLDDAQGRQVDWMHDWAATVDRANVEAQAGPGQQRPRGRGQPIGFLTDAEVNGLAEHGIAPATALLAAGDDTIYHALRLDKFRGREHLRELFAEQVKQIPRWRDTPGSYVSVLDIAYPDTPKILVIRKISDGQYMRMVLAINDRRKYSRENITVQAVDTIEIADLDALKRYRVIEGRWEDLE